MRSKWIFCVILGMASAAFAKEPKPYQTAKIVRMDSVQCGTAEKDARSLVGQIAGTDAVNTKTQEVLCQEYTVQAERVTYRIRPRDGKHPVLLPLGERAQFRLQKDKMRLRMEGLNSKEHEYIVVSMTPRSENSTADATSLRLNHLQ